MTRTICLCPDQKYTFGTVKAAQARGDFQVLADRKRRALRVHLPKDVEAGLEKLKRGCDGCFDLKSRAEGEGTLL